MEKPAYELSERSDVDKLQLISGSTASTLPRDHSGFNYYPSDVGSKATQQPRSNNCLQNCCLVIVGVIAVLALCAAVASIILIVAFPNVTNPAIQEVLAFKNQLISQTGSTATPSVDLSPIRDEMRMTRETLQTSINSLGDTLNAIRNSLDSSLGTVSTLMERLVTVQENETCMNPPEPQIGTVGNPASSCRDIPADRPSGNYWIYSDSNTCPIQVYCDLDGSACSCRCDTTEGGWMRVANFNMKDPNQNCPDEFIEITSNNPPLRLCGRPGPEGCSTVFFPVNGVEYSRVCGKVIGYRKGTPDGLHNGGSGIDGPYVDGVSITHGSPRTHIWTFVTSWAFTENNGGCPCDTNNHQGSIPPFIGIDYFCEAGNATTCCDFNLVPDNPVWDGEGCVEGSTCCVLNTPPYFCKTLDAPTSDTIEVRMCGSQIVDDEDTPIEVVELYVY